MSPLVAAVNLAIVPSTPFSSIEDANAKRVTLCALADSSAVLFMRANWPKIRLVTDTFPNYYDTFLNGDCDGVLVQVIAVVP